MIPIRGRLESLMVSCSATQRLCACILFFPPHGNVCPTGMADCDPFGRSPLHRRGVETAMEHGENDLPIPICAPFVVDIALGQCISVVGTLMHLIPVGHAACW